MLRDKTEKYNLLQSRSGCKICIIQDTWPKYG